MANPNDSPLLDPDEIARLTAEFEQATGRESLARGAFGEAPGDDSVFGGGPIDDEPIDDGPIGDFPFDLPTEARPASAGRGFASSSTPVAAVQFGQLSPHPANSDSTLDLLLDVQLQVSVELGRTRLTIKDLLALAPGAVVELDKVAGEAVDVLVNGTLVAYGEVVVVDEKFGVRVTEVISTAKRTAALG